MATFWNCHVRVERSEKLRPFRVSGKIDSKASNSSACSSAFAIPTKTFSDLDSRTFLLIFKFSRCRHLFPPTRTVRCHPRFFSLRSGLMSRIAPELTLLPSNTGQIAHSRAYNSTTDFPDQRQDGAHFAGWSRWARRR